MLLRVFMCFSHTFKYTRSIVEKGIKMNEEKKERLFGKKELAKFVKMQKRDKNGSKRRYSISKTKK